MSNHKHLNLRGLFKVSALALLAGSVYAQSMPQGGMPPQGGPGGPGPSAASAPAPQQPLSLPPTASFATSPASSANAAEIQRINEEMTVMTARLAQLELQSKIAAKQKEISGMDTTQESSRSPLNSGASTPSVVSVSGLKGHLEAVLVFPQGLSQRVKKGDVIGDRKVAMVAINQVVLTDMAGKNPQRLAFGTTATAITREGGPSAGQGGFPMGNIPGAPPQFPPR